jgi:hypothetical protein
MAGKKSFLLCNDNAPNYYISRRTLLDLKLEAYRKANRLAIGDSIELGDGFRLTRET